MKNFACTFTDQSVKYQKLAKDNQNIYDEDIKNCLKVTKRIFEHLSNSFKKWGKLQLVICFRR